MQDDLACSVARMLAIILSIPNVCSSIKISPNKDLDVMICACLSIWEMGTATEVASCRC